MSERLSVTMRAVSDPVRRDLLHTLMRSEVPTPLHALTDKFEMSRQGVSKHIKVLEEAGLVVMTKEGRERLCQADPLPLKKIQEWLSTYEVFWTDSLDRLKNHLDKG